MIVVPNLSLASIQTCPTGKDSQRLYKSRPFSVLLQCSRVSNFKAWEATLITSGQKRRCDCYDMHNVLVPYSEAWSWQKSIVGEEGISRTKPRPFQLPECFTTPPGLYIGYW
ncbi:hypothetical protein RHMOL_Rhmol06G0050500 [Rhododendron molle]|uniref:Uncharacterized protein n=1 Tax=Rhododendron molle TaxID=49168 RepID=A0ACC0NAV1_RHOML|nr:hypothetical protein RHMOL_Rhmol06G0050500 [Rhododendron molle]